MRLYDLVRSCDATFKKLFDSKVVWNFKLKYALNPSKLWLKLGLCSKKFLHFILYYFIENL